MEETTRALGNILWHSPFLGFVDAILVFLLGLVLTVTVVAVPIGLGLMEHGKFLFAPFDHEMVSQSRLGGKQNPVWKTYSTIVMILYIPFGIVFSIITVFQIVGLAFSIIGIPVAIVLAKSLSTYFNPVNKKCVHHSVAAGL
jgi:uncharacterized membrane protein YccF (DUF307 family)